MNHYWWRAPTRDPSRDSPRVLARCRGSTGPSAAPFDGLRAPVGARPAPPASPLPVLLHRRQAISCRSGELRNAVPQY
jgi:hypothetical protein